ncbi:hypothetical protein [Streptomyces sp. NPDC006552]|uniref:hypothetical protein n=1 Tax=Streptomyces sp. NPDC006552 TaxID=3157179 RepID=UPI0033ACA0EF
MSLTALRAPAVRRLLILRAARRLTRAHVCATAQCLNVSERSVWRWLAEATTTPASAARPGARRADRFEIIPEIRVLLAYWHGNASAVHRELLARARTATDIGPFIWQRFTRLTQGEVLQTIPLYHPIWADADPDDLAYADSRAAHGNFRNWARLTALTHTALKRTGRPRVDQEVLRWVFSKRNSAH